MTITTRILDERDHEKIIEISESVWEDDYVPDNFKNWVKDPLWTPIGCFDNGTLVSFAALEEKSEYAEVKALRTHSEHQKKGYGVRVVDEIVSLAKDKGIRDLRYCTSSRNSGSMKLAERAGFMLTEEVGYVRLYSPFPPHPKPSSSLIPVEVDAERAFDAIQSAPELVENKFIPVAWEFEDKTLEGLKRLEKETTFNLTIGLDGKPLGFFFKKYRERKGIKTIVHSVFTNERSVFVDIISRLLEEVDSDVDRCVFFLGNSGGEWMEDMAILPDDWERRKFLFYQLLM